MDGSVLKSTSPSKLLLIDNILRFGWSLRKSYKGFQTEPNETCIEVPSWNFQLKLAVLT